MIGESKAVLAKEYQSRLRDWNTTARVRSGPRRCIGAEELPEKLFFSPRLVPVTKHPMVKELGPAFLREILVQHLYGYLEFTAQFEAEVVNYAAKAVARRKTGFDLPEEMVRDAYRIYCDEGYHSVFSAELKYEAEQVTGIAALPYDFDKFLERLNHVLEVVPPEMKELARLFTAIMFETLISATLNRIPKDEQVVTAVRELVADHAEDEARHHFYFASLMDFIWPRLSAPERCTMGPLLADLIIKCLEPDLPAIGAQLSKCGVALDDAEQIVADSYPPAEIISGIRKTARATLNILERNGVFRDARTLDAFRERQLVTSEADPRKRTVSFPVIRGLQNGALNMNRGILSAIGKTPLVELTRIFQPSNFTLYAKLESLNPGGSMKDRAAMSILQKGFDTGAITKETVIIESSSGNMGVGLAQACAYFGLRFICVVDPKTTQQNIRLLEAYGAEVDLVTEPDPKTREFLQARLNRVKELIATTENGFWPNQYANLANPAAHHQTMHEIATALNGNIDYLFCATSTCGTLRGCSEYIREHGLKTKVVAIDAVGSVIFGAPRSKRLVPGHGAAVVPPLFTSDLADEFVLVDDVGAIAGCRNLAQTEAILAGGSSGAIITGIDLFREEIPAGAVCVAILADRGERYLDTVFSDAWVTENFGDVSHLWRRNGGTNMRYGSVLVLNGNDVLSLLTDRMSAIMDAVKGAYECHSNGFSSLPHSTFLRFPDSDRNRIIALPAYLGGDRGGAGVKWVSSFPANLGKGMDRASAMIILNNTLTGRPQAIMEGSVINAKRTAASAAVAATYLHGDKAVDRLGIAGCGLIGFEAQRFLLEAFPGIQTSYIFDIDPLRAEKFKVKSENAFPNLNVKVVEDLHSLLAECPLSVLATTAIKPHITDLNGIAPGSTILHLSLRDLAPETIVECDNVVDDIDHVCRAETSLHLAEKMLGNRDFIRCTLADITLGRAPARRDPECTSIFSPFGLGVLDIAVSRLAYDLALKEGRGTVLESFVPDQWV